MNAPSKTNLSTFREEAKERLEEHRSQAAKAAMLGNDLDMADAEGRAEELEWVLDQDPIVPRAKERAEDTSLLADLEAEEKGLRGEAAKVRAQYQETKGAVDGAVMHTLSLAADRLQSILDKHKERRR